MKHNEVIYGRISKVENQESRIQKDAREHMKRIDVVKEYDSKLKADCRRRIAVGRQVPRQQCRIVRHIARARVDDGLLWCGRARGRLSDAATGAVEHRRLDD